MTDREEALGNLGTQIRALFGEESVVSAVVNELRNKGEVSLSRVKQLAWENGIDQQRAITMVENNFKLFEGTQGITITHPENIIRLDS